MRRYFKFKLDDVKCVCARNSTAFQMVYSLSSTYYVLSFALCATIQITLIKNKHRNMHPHTYVYMHAHAHTVIRAQTHKICDFSDVSPPSTQLRSINVGETNGFLLRGAITRRPPDNHGVTRLDLQNKDTLCSFLVTPPNIKCTDDEIKITISIHE